MHEQSKAKYVLKELTNMTLVTDHEQKKKRDRYVQTIASFIDNCQKKEAKCESCVWRMNDGCQEWEKKESGEGCDDYMTVNEFMETIDEA